MVPASCAVLGITLALLHEVESLVDALSRAKHSLLLLVGSHYSLWFLQEVEVGALHDDLAVGVPGDELGLSIAQIHSATNHLDLLTQLSLLHLMLAVLVVLVVELVYDSLPVLDDVEGSVLQVRVAAHVVRVLSQDGDDT